MPSWLAAQLAAALGWGGVCFGEEQKDWALKIQTHGVGSYSRAELGSCSMFLLTPHSAPGMDLRAVHLGWGCTKQAGRPIATPPQA